MNEAIRTASFRGYHAVSYHRLAEEEAAEDFGFYFEPRQRIRCASCSTFLRIGKIPGNHCDTCQRKVDARNAEADRMMLNAERRMKRLA